MSLCLCCLCLLYILSAPASSLTTLLQHSLPPCAGPHGQLQVRNLGLYMSFLGMCTALNVCVHFQIPRNMLQLSKDSDRHPVPQFSLDVFCSAFCCTNTCRLLDFKVTVLVRRWVGLAQLKLIHDLLFLPNSGNFLKHFLD